MPQASEWTPATENSRANRSLPRARAKCAFAPLAPLKIRFTLFVECRDAFLYVVGVISGDGGKRGVLQSLFEAHGLLLVLHPLCDAHCARLALRQSIGPAESGRHELGVGNHFGD